MWVEQAGYTGQVVGLDVGLASFYTDSNGQVVSHPLATAGRSPWFPLKLGHCTRTQNVEFIEPEGFSQWLGRLTLT